MTHNNTNIAAIINEKNEYFKNLVAKVEKSKLPSIIHTIAEVGAENIFYISKSYRGLYEDDFCDFTYWNNITGEFIYDHWATNFAAPNYHLYIDNIFTVDEAAQANLFNKDVVREFNIKRLYNYINSTKVNMDVYEKNYPMVKVEGGRKWKGMGYFVEKITIKSNYGDRVEAKVFSLEDFQIHYCSYKYVQFVELESLIEQYKAYANEYIDKCVQNDALYNIFDYENANLLWGFKFDRMMSIDDFIVSKRNRVEYLVENAYDPIEEERKRKLSEKRANRFANIVEWVKQNTDKTTEGDIQQLALHILQKNG